MTKEEFSKIAAAIRTFYPNQNILPNIESVSLWYIQLCDIDYETMTAAVYEWVATNKWAPTIADLRESSRRITMGDIPDWNSAYEHSRSVIRKYGYYRYEEGMAQLSGVELETVKAIGYVDWCKSDNPSVIRAQYRDIYNAIAARRKHEDQLPPGLKNALNMIREKEERRLLEDGGNQ